MATETEIENRQDSPSFEDLHLVEFQKNNPQCKFSIQEKQLLIERPWDTEDVRFAFDISDLASIEDMNNIAFRHQFDAIFHLDDGCVEFIFGFLPPDEEPFRSYIGRRFQFNFEGVAYECSYEKPTDRLLALAKRFRRLPSDSGIVVAPQLLAFRDVQRLEKLPAAAEQYFKNKEPRSFILRCDRAPLSFDIASVARHLNLVMLYYDRRSAQIVIRSSESDARFERTRPCRYINGEFPQAFSIAPVDDFILQLIEVARDSNPRFAFIYYYQVFEYAGFYYVDEKAKRELRRYLRDPAMINCSEDRLSELFSVLTEITHNDEIRMRKVIEDYCDPRALWEDITHDKEFFCTPTVFEGGFELPPFIAQDTTIDTWCTMWMPKLFDQLTKIRNCLVHARERRQSRVILPTRANNYLIERYLHVIARLAEQIAFRTA